MELTLIYMSFEFSCITVTNVWYISLVPQMYQSEINFFHFVIEIIKSLYSELSLFREVARSIIEAAIWLPVFSELNYLYAQAFKSCFAWVLRNRTYI